MFAWWSTYVTLQCNFHLIRWQYGDIALNGTLLQTDVTLLQTDVMLLRSDFTLLPVHTWYTMTLHYMSVPTFTIMDFQHTISNLEKKMRVKTFFWSETSLVSLGVKSVRSLIRITRRCSSPLKAILVHKHWGHFLNWFWIPQRERWRGNQCILRISERIAFISVRPRPR